MGREEEYPPPPHYTTTSTRLAQAQATAAHNNNNEIFSDSDTEPDIDESRIDPELRLRTVRTAASTIAESVRQESNIARQRRRRLGLGRSLRSKEKGKGKSGGTWKISLRRKGGVKEDEELSTVVDEAERPFSMVSTQVGSAPPPSDERRQSLPPKPGFKTVGRRRNIYVNLSLPPNELNTNGEPALKFTRNKVRTTSKSLYKFYLLLLINHRVHTTFIRP